MKQQKTHGNYTMMSEENTILCCWGKIKMLSLTIVKTK